MTASPQDTKGGSCTWATRSQALAAALVAVALLIGLSSIAFHQSRVGDGIEVIRAGGDGPIYKVDINHAEAPELMLLPGIGDVRAQRILKRRQEVGVFSSFEEFQRAAGVGQKHMDEIRRVATLGSEQGTEP